MEKKDEFFPRDSRGITQTGLVAALYVAVTLLVSPVSFGPIQFRISEALNYLGLFRKRYVTAVSIGVLIVNAIFSTPLDVLVGTSHTVLSFLVSRYLAEKLAHRFSNPKLASFIIMAIVFSLAMFIIAWMLVHVGEVPYFWETYLTLALSELIAMALGGLIIYSISERIDFTK